MKKKYEIRLPKGTVRDLKKMEPALMDFLCNRIHETAEKPVWFVNHPPNLSPSPITRGPHRLNLILSLSDGILLYTVFHSPS